MGRRAPLAVSLVVGVLAVAVLPWAGRALGPHDSVLPAVLALVAAFDLLSVFLLAHQFHADGDARVLAMAASYTWSLVIMLGYAATFPGILAKHPPLETAPSVPAWLYVVWHTSFPVLLALAWAPWPWRLTRTVPSGYRRGLVWLSQLGPLFLAGAAASLIIVRGPELPVIIVGLSTHRMTTLTAPLSVPLVAVSAAITTWALRARPGPERWTATAVWVCLADLGLTYWSEHRFSVGWYMGRTLTVLAAGVVLFAMLRETTHLKAALTATLERERRVELQQRVILDNLGVAVVLTDLGGEVLMVNAATRAQFPDTRPGESPVVLPARTADGEAVASEDRPAARTARTGVALRDVLQVVTRPDGEEVWLSVNTTLVTDPGGRPSAVVSSYADVSERERSHRDLRATARQLAVARDEAQAADRAKSAFLAAMSHEIRTPMNAVIGLTDLLLDSALDSDQRELTGIVRTSGEALLVIINDILDFSRIESGLLDLDDQPFDLRDCVDSSLALVALGKGDRELDLVAEVDPGCPDVVVGDVTRFRQVLVNLLGNAVKFTPRGEVVVHISAHPLPGGPDGRIEVLSSVRDTGIGIPADRLDRLFAWFSQVDSSTTRVYGGTGLGLAISRRLAEAMGGALTVTSEVDVGSVFTFSAVLVEQRDRRLPAAAAVPGPLAGMSVLAVDARDSSRRALRALLTRWGMVCIEAADAAGALAVVTGRRPVDINPVDISPVDISPVDLVIIADTLPGTGAHQLAEQVRGLAAGRTLPLVLLGEQRARQPARPDLFAATLTRPVQSSALRGKLLAILAPVDAAITAVETVGGHRGSDSPAVGDSRPLVLLAEDNVVNQKVAQLMLDRLGYRVETVVDGLAAVRAVRNSGYALVLMDVQMPTMDGLQATRTIRAELPADRQPPIIGLSANVLTADRLACLQAGMNDYLSKPVRSDDLRAALTRVLTAPATISAVPPVPLHP